MDSMASRNGQARYTSRDVLLYAFGIGCSADQKNEMKYLYEYDPNFCAFPTFLLSLPFRASDLAIIENGGAKKDMDLGMFDLPTFPPTFLKPPSFLFSPSLKQTTPVAAIHLSQKYRLYKPIPITTSFPPSAPIAVDFRTEVISAVPHKRGSIVVTETQCYLQQKGKRPELLATSQSVALYPLRIDQDKASKEVRTSPTMLKSISFPGEITKTKPSFVKRYSISNNQALLYRLSGDTNRIHVEGFPELFLTTQPILHGLCTLGYAVRAVLSALRADAFATSMGKDCHYVECRFKKPVFVGDEIEVRVWADETPASDLTDGIGEDVDTVVYFEVWNLKHNVVAVDRGIAGLGTKLSGSDKYAMPSRL